MEGEQGVQQQLVLAKMDCKDIKSVHLVEDIIEEILLRLPVKSLMRFRCVSKSWLSLISSERFIKAHFQNRVMFECDGDVYMQCSVQQWLNEASSVEPYSIYDPANNNQFLREAEIVGSCNGLLCVLNYQRDSLFLWNPTTMIFMELPKSYGLGFEKIGFGWDGTSGAYKVFASSTPNGSVGNVYSSKTNSWKTVEVGCHHVYDIYGVFACGKIHWLESGAYIESFDLESEEFERIELPPPPTGFSHPVFTHPSYTLAEIWGCLHLVCLLHFHDQQLYAVVWVMKEESRWLKLFSHPLVIGSIVLSSTAILAGGLNGEILVILNDNYYLVYSPKQDVVVREGMHKIKFGRGLVYVESLVSPNFTTPS